MKKMVLEPFMGLLLIAMVFLAVQYGGVEVLSGEAAGMTERPTVVIDAGHGGSDPGKVGVDGSLERTSIWRLPCALRNIWSSRMCA